MAIADLANVLKIFGGGEPTAEEQQELFKEVALMTLGRATSADTKIMSVEVLTVQNALSDLTGEEFSTADIRLAASSALFESAPLEKYLARSSKRLDTAQCNSIVSALAEVIQSDVRISPMEVDYFNRVTEALNITRSDLAGLKPDH